MTADCTLSRCLQRLVRGCWVGGAPLSPTESSTDQSPQQRDLLVSLRCMPPPMLALSSSHPPWPEVADQCLRLLLLVFREHLQLACRFLLLQRKTAMTAQIDRAIDVLLRACDRAGNPLTPASAEQLRAEALQVLPNVLPAQIDLHRAIGFGGLSSRLAVVLGMHRSGTSALTGMLAKAGLDVPDDLMDRPDDVINLKGYWESEGMMQVNDQLFADLGLHWSSSDQLPSSWDGTDAARQWRHRWIDQLRRTCEGSDHPVIKDPRMCVLMAGMRPLLEAAAMQFTFFLPIRHPLEVARSLQTAQGTPLDRGIALWIAHVRQAERNTRDQCRLIIPFRDLMQQPLTVLHRCQQILHLNDERADPRDEAAAFIDPSLQRQRDEAAMMDLSEGTSSLLATALELHDTLVEHAADDASLHQRMDAIKPVDGPSA